jgi:hypothetical protein
VEKLWIQEEIKVHDHRNAKRRIQRKKFLESAKLKWSPLRKCGERRYYCQGLHPATNRTQGMESPASDSKSEFSPWGNMVFIQSENNHEKNLIVFF